MEEEIAKISAEWRSFTQENLTLGSYRISETISSSIYSNLGLIKMGRARLTIIFSCRVILQSNRLCKICQ